MPESTDGSRATSVGKQALTQEVTEHYYYFSLLINIGPAGVGGGGESSTLPEDSATLFLMTSHFRNVTDTAKATVPNTS